MSVAISDRLAPSGAIDGEQAASDATRHLLALGHRCVGLLVGDPGSIYVAQRGNAVTSALRPKRNAHPPPPRAASSTRAAHSAWTASSSRPCSRRLLRDERRSWRAVLEEHFRARDSTTPPGPCTSTRRSAPSPNHSNIHDVQPLIHQRTPLRQRHARYLERRRNIDLRGKHAGRLIHPHNGRRTADVGLRVPLVIGRRSNNHARIRSDSRDPVRQRQNHVTTLPIREVHRRDARGHVPRGEPRHQQSPPLARNSNFLPGSLQSIRRPHRRRMPNGRHPKCRIPLARAKPSRRQSLLRERPPVSRNSPIPRIGSISHRRLVHQRAERQRSRRNARPLISTDVRRPNRSPTRGGIREDVPAAVVVNPNACTQ